MTTTPTFSRADLAQFTGTEHWYRHPLVRHILYTDGARYVADTANAYWLLDEIAFAQIGNPVLGREAFQLWTLKVAGNASAELVCEDGDGHAVFAKHIAWTDFPAEGIALYFINNVIHLPSEY